MVILNPLEPWPGELVLRRRRAPRRAADHPRRRLRRAVPRRRARPATRSRAATTASFRPAGWVERGREQLERMRPIAERHGLTMLQLACAWNLAHEPVACVAPTLIQEPGEDARPIEDKRAELAAVAGPVVLTRRRGRRDPRDRRQHRLDGAQGRRARLRGRAAARPLAARATSCPSSPAAGASTPRATWSQRRLTVNPAAQRPITRADESACPHRRALLAVALPRSRCRPSRARRRGRDHAPRHARRAADVNLVDVAATAAVGRRAGRAAVRVVRRRAHDRRHRARRAARRLAALQGRLRPPADRPDRFAGWRDALQANVALDPALPRRPERRRQGAAGRHGHALRPAVRRHPGRRT